MFNKEKKSSFTTELIDSKNELNRSITNESDDFANFSNIVSRNVLTSCSNIGAASFIVASDIFANVGKRLTLMNYTDEIDNICDKRENIDKIVFIDKFTKNVARKDFINIMCKDILPWMVNRTTYKKALTSKNPILTGINFLNIPGLIGIGAAEGVDKLVTTIEKKHYTKTNEVSKLAATNYYDGTYHYDDNTSSNFIQNKKNSLKKELITYSITSLAYGSLIGFCRAKGIKRENENKGSNSIIIGFIDTVSDTKKDKTNKNTKHSSTKILNEKGKK